jgi:hypothetical protein
MATATTKAPPKRFALYLEARPSAGNGKEVYTRQALVMPPHRDPATREWKWPSIYYRSVAPTNPRSRWRFTAIHGLVRNDTFTGPTFVYSSPADDSLKTHYMTRIEQQSLVLDRRLDVQEVVSEVMDSNAYEYVMDWLNTMMGKPDVYTIQKPLYVEVTDTDARDAYQKQTPSALLRRLERVRRDSGFPESVTEPVTKSIPALLTKGSAV